MKKVLNSEAVKIIALVTMLIDHIGYIMYGHIDTGVYNVLRGIGRISFPLFAFLIAEGFFYTKDGKKYLLRIMSFAFISEIPFNIVSINSFLLIILLPAINPDICHIEVPRQYLIFTI